MTTGPITVFSRKQLDRSARITLHETLKERPQPKPKKKRRSRSDPARREAAVRRKFIHDYLYSTERAKSGEGAPGEGLNGTS